MKFTGAILVLFTLLCLGCERTTDKTTVTEKDRTDTITVTRNESERNLSDFRDWVNEKTSRGDSAARREAPETKEGFKRRTTEIERSFDSLSADSKAEYKALRERYQRWEAGKAQRENTPLQEATLRTFETRLLGPYSNYSSITPENIKEVYIHFMQKLRPEKNKLSPGDWDYVDHVYSRLNSRKAEMESSIATSDKLKIKALQTEYLTLEAAGDVKDLGSGVRK